MRTHSGGYYVWERMGWLRLGSFYLNDLNASLREHVLVDMVAVFMHGNSTDAHLRSFTRFSTAALTETLLPAEVLAASADTVLVWTPVWHCVRIPSASKHMLGPCVHISVTADRHNSSRSVPVVDPATFDCVVHISQVHVSVPVTGSSDSSAPTSVSSVTASAFVFM